MKEKHLIKWIELTASKKVYWEFLELEQALEDVKARALCDLHGLW